MECATRFKCDKNPACHTQSFQDSIPVGQPVGIPVKGLQICEVRFCQAGGNNVDLCGKVQTFNMAQLV